jgi:hypothetical protein
MQALMIIKKITVNNDQGHDAQPKNMIPLRGRDQVQSERQQSKPLDCHMQSLLTTFTVEFSALLRPQSMVAVSLFIFQAPHKQMTINFIIIIEIEHRD